MDYEKKSAMTAKEVWKEMRLEVYQQASGNRHEPNMSDDSTKMFSLNDIDEIFEKISDTIAWLEKQGECMNKSLTKFTFDDVLALQCCMETVKKVQEDKELYEELNLLHSKVYDAYQLEKQGSSNLFFA